MSNPRNFKCSNCMRPLRALTLPAHYQKTVDIDVCEPCGLIWFDEAESARLAAPGIAELIRTIHAAVSADALRPPAATLLRQQCCPVCGSGLDKVFNASRFGRTAQWQCPKGHGYYQTYMLYLAEKGFIRPLQWRDLSALARHGRQLYCANCGAGLPAHPCEHCPNCQSAVGVLDPARLASAIDLDCLTPSDGAAAVAPALKQAHCERCGGAIDATRDLSCPYCNAPIRAIATDAAADAVAAVDAPVRQNYAKQMPKVTLARLRAIEGTSAHGSYFDQLIATKASVFKFKMVGALAVMALLFSMYGVMTWMNRGSGEQAPGDAIAAAAWFEQHYAEPVIECSADAATRSAVRIRTIAVSTDAIADGPALGGPGADMRAALATIRRTRSQWVDGKPYDEVLLHTTGSEAFGQPMPPLLERGQLPPRLERVAFCIGVNQISPIILSGRSFYLLQVVAADQK